MSFKTFLLLLLIPICGTFIYLRLQTSGDLNSKFNQTTRFVLGKHPVLRTLFGLHNVGDARAEFLSGSGPISILWFKPNEEEVSPDMLKQFATLVSKYTGRTTTINLAGPIDDNTIQLSNLSSLTFQKNLQKPAGASLLLVVFAKDYSPRAADELSTTYEDSGIVISMDAHRNFVQDYPQSLDSYELSSLLHEFGHQIGLVHSQDPNCIMDEHAGINGQPQELFGDKPPTDFCPAEQDLIKQLKAQY